MPLPKPAMVPLFEPPPATLPEPTPAPLPEPAPALLLAPEPAPLLTSTPLPANDVTSRTVSPEEIRPFPQVRAETSTRKRRTQGRTVILTSTPEKTAGARKKKTPAPTTAGRPAKKGLDVA